MSARRALFAVLALALPQQAAFGADAPAPALPEKQAPQICQLGQAASLDVKTGAEGMIFVGATVDGHKGDFLIDTGGMGLVLNATTATRLDNTPQRAFLGGEFFGGSKLEYGVLAKRMQIGSMSTTQPWFLIAPDRFFASDAMGNIQPHSLWPRYDVEIDFMKGKLNLFLPNQCPGNVIYWTHEAYAAVPMTLDVSGHIVVGAVLDGKPIDAVIDTGAQRSLLSLRAASHNLDIDEDSKGIEARGSVVINEDVEAKRYRYPFKTLTFEGITIDNPQIEIANTGNDSRHDPLVLGIALLRQLHLFIAYDEKKLYLTPAEAY
jgi:predicted aspartyl protease